MDNMPKVGKQHEKLAAFVGNWTGEEKIHPSPWDPVGGTATAKTKGKMILDGFFVTLDYVQKRGGKVSYRGVGYIGWDAMAKQYTMNWFSNMGEGSAPARGEWNGKKLSFSQSNPMGHSRYTFTFANPDSYKMLIENSETGEKWATFMEGIYKRSSPTKGS